MCYRRFAINSEKEKIGQRREITKEILTRRSENIGKHFGSKERVLKDTVWEPLIEGCLLCP